jgi:hypothetical protein
MPLLSCFWRTRGINRGAGVYIFRCWPAIDVLSMLCVDFLFFPHEGIYGEDLCGMMANRLFLLNKPRLACLVPFIPFLCCPFRGGGHA